MAFSHVAEVATANENRNDATAQIAASPSQTLEAGNLVAVWVVMDNASTTNAESTDLTVTDSVGGNTWTRVGEGTATSGSAKDGVTAALFVSKLANQIGTGDTITVTNGVGGATGAKGLVIHEFTMGSGDLTSAGATVQTVATNTDPGSITLSGLDSREYLWLHLVGIELAGTTLTEDADYTEITETGSAGGASLLNVTVMGGWRIATLTSDTLDPTASGNSTHVQILGAVYEAAGAHQKTLTAAVETDSGQALSFVKTIFETLTAAAETDAAQALSFTQGAPQNISITAATETDLVAGVVFHRLTAAAETDAAQTLTFSQAGGPFDLTPAAETDSAQALSFTKTIFKTVTAAVETGAAQALGVTKTIFKTLTAAAETDAAQTVAYSQAGTVNLVPAAETDAAQALSVTHVHFRTLTPASETGAAQALTFSQAGSYQIAPAVETDAAVALAFTQTGPREITPAAETDAAATLSLRKIVSIGAALEVETATAAGVSRKLVLSPAAETGAAQTVAFLRRATLTPAVETDEAQILAFLGGLVIVVFFDLPSPDGGAGVALPGGGGEPATPDAVLFDPPTPTRVIT